MTASRRFGPVSVASPGVLLVVLVVLVLVAVVVVLVLVGVVLACY